MKLSLKARFWCYFEITTKRLQRRKFAFYIEIHIDFQIHDIFPESVANPIYKRVHSTSLFIGFPNECVARVCLLINILRSFS